MHQKERAKTFANLTLQERMEFVMFLNSLMVNYENNIERRMAFSEKIEKEEMQSEPVSSRNLKRRKCIEKEV